MHKPRTCGWAITWLKIRLDYQTAENIWNPAILLIDHVSSVDHHGTALHEARLATAEEEHAIGDFLRCAWSLHRRDVDVMLAVLDLGSGHGRVDESALIIRRVPRA